MTDNQQVEAGAVLVQLDRRTYQAIIDRATAELADAEAAARAAQAGVPIVPTTTTSGVTTAEAGVGEARAAVQATSRRSSPWPSSSRRSRGSAGSRSRSRCARSTGSGARPRSTAPAGSRRPSRRRPASTTSTRASAPRGATSRTFTAVAQAFFNKQEGVARLVTETGAGQWGSALAFAGAVFGLRVDVFMVRVSYDQKPYRRALMESYGARCVPSPSRETATGRAVLETRADHPGSLGIAISEAVEAAAQRDDTKYALGSVLNHVLLHQTVLGQEALAQLDLARCH